MKIKCKICGREVIDHHFGHHLTRTHNKSPSAYYLENIADKNSEVGKCKSCGKDTRFKSIARGFQEFCGIKCSNSFGDKKSKTKQVCLEKYGVENVFQNEDIKKIMKKTVVEKYGVENVSQSELIKKQKRDTIKINYGDDYAKIVVAKRIKTCLKKYGVRHYAQTHESSYKSIKNSYKKKPYVLPSGATIYKQGYELNFLEHIFKLNLFREDDVIYYPKTIRYSALDNIEHHYFPDFYIPKNNLIVECKSTWTLQTDKNLKLKEAASKSAGFAYICIVNNKFEEFDKIIV